MDPRELFLDWQQAFETALVGLQARLWTSLPGIVEAYDAGTMTATVSPAIQGVQYNEQRVASNINLPQLIYCPVIFPGGGDFVLTFPLAKGDEVKVLFACRCIDGWWQSGGIQPQAELRLHDISDGFCLPRLFSKPNAPTSASTRTAQLRTLDGSTYLEIDGGVINIEGNLVVSGNIEAGTGATGVFTTPTGQTVTVQDGIITSIS